MRRASAALLRMHRSLQAAHAAALPGLTSHALPPIGGSQLCGMWQAAISMPSAQAIRSWSAVPAPAAAEAEAAALAPCERGPQAQEANELDSRLMQAGQEGGAAAVLQLVEEEGEHLTVLNVATATAALAAAAPGGGMSPDEIVRSGAFQTLVGEFVVTEGSLLSLLQQPPYCGVHAESAGRWVGAREAECEPRRSFAHQPANALVCPLLQTWCWRACSCLSPACWRRWCTAAGSWAPGVSQPAMAASRASACGPRGQLPRAADCLVTQQCSTSLPPSPCCTSLSPRPQRGDASG